MVHTSKTGITEAFFKRIAVRSIPICFFFDSTGQAVLTVSRTTWPLLRKCNKCLLKVPEHDGVKH